MQKKKKIIKYFFFNVLNLGYVMNFNYFKNGKRLKVAKPFFFLFPTPFFRLTVLLKTGPDERYASYYVERRRRRRRKKKKSSQ